MLRYLPALVLTSSVTAASACGYCVEDKIAAVYDHAAASRALQENRTVVFFAIDGALRAGEAQKRKLEAIVASVPGVDRQSVRLSIELATLALAFDPRGQIWARCRACWTASSRRSDCRCLRCA